MIIEQHHATVVLDCRNTDQSAPMSISAVYGNDEVTIEMTVGNAVVDNAVILTRDIADEISNGVCFLVGDQDSETWHGQDGDVSLSADPATGTLKLRAPARAYQLGNPRPTATGFMKPHYETVAITIDVTLTNIVNLDAVLWGIHEETSNAVALRDEFDAASDQPRWLHDWDNA